MNPMNADGRIPFAVESGWQDSSLISNFGGPSYRLLFYSDTDVRFEHECDRAQRNAGIIICAPRLTNVNQPGGHQVTGTRQCPTVRASIMCEDCGTHGFITEGRWGSV
jgi:hypothetical protein